MRNCLAHFLGNLPALEAGDKVEAVHQMRVAMRRLRSALSLFGRAFPHAGIRGAAGGIEADRRRCLARRAIGTCSSSGSATARSRDSPTSRASTVLRDAAEAKAAAGHAAVARLAGDKPVARFALRLERLAATRGWRDGAGDDGARRARRAGAWRSPRDALEALDRKVRRRGRRFRSLTPESRHALRIAMKHMRYATEFFGALFHRGSRPPSATLRKAAALQDLLGELNDAAIAERLVKTLDLADEPARRLRRGRGDRMVRARRARATRRR